MKESEAVKDLYLMMRTLQRYRSTTKEQIGPGTGDLHLSDELAADMWPWVFGAKNPLPALNRILDAVEKGKGLQPMDYYNQMTILTRFMPEILMGCNIQLLQAGLPELPDHAPLTIMGGWDPEDD